MNDERAECECIEPMLPDYVVGRFAEGGRQAAEIRAHLAGCERCREIERDMRVLDVALAAARGVKLDVPEDYAKCTSDAVARRIGVFPAQAEAPQPPVRLPTLRPHPLWWVMPAAVSFAACTLVAALVGLRELDWRGLQQEREVAVRPTSPRTDETVEPSGQTRAVEVVFDRDGKKKPYRFAASEGDEMARRMIEEFEAFTSSVFEQMNAPRPMVDTRRSTPGGGVVHPVAQGAGVPGAPPRAMLGATVAVPAPAASFGIAKPEPGLLVISVEPGSPADRLGLQPDDVLLRVGSADLKVGGQVAFMRLRAELDNVRPGGSLPVVFMRGGRVLSGKAVFE